jgi:hypothetical protein
MGKPELHQRIKNRGTNFDECFAVTFAKSRLEQVNDSETVPHQTEE